MLFDISKVIRQKYLSLYHLKVYMYSTKFILKRRRYTAQNFNRKVFQRLSCMDVHCFWTLNWNCWRSDRLFVVGNYVVPLSSPGPVCLYVSFLCLCILWVWFSVPVQSIGWRDSSLKWFMHNLSSGTLNFARPFIHSLAHVDSKRATIAASSQLLRTSHLSDVENVGFLYNKRDRQTDRQAGRPYYSGGNTCVTDIVQRIQGGPKSKHLLIYH